MFRKIFHINTNLGIELPYTSAAKNWFHKQIGLLHFSSLQTTNRPIPFLNEEAETINEIFLSKIKGLLDNSFLEDLISQIKKDFNEMRADYFKAEEEIDSSGALKLLLDSELLEYAEV